MSLKNRPETPEHVTITFGPDEDDPEQIVRTFICPPGFPYLELVAIGEMIEAENIFIPGYIPPPVGTCHPDAFIFESQFEGVKTILLPDRNIASRMAKIVDGVRMDEVLRKVAAIKSFCHFLDIEIEPAVAFHELAHRQGNEIANEELARFRDADNADPYLWLDLAFGNVDHTDPPEHRRKVEAIDLAKPLRRWRRNYIAALKIAELELDDKKRNIDRVLSLFNWMRNDFLIAGPAALLACIYFAPNSPPRKGLFKSLRSTDRRRAVDGVKNAAWDLTHLSELVRMVNNMKEEPPIRMIFASFDDGLRNLARLLFDASSECFRAQLLADQLKTWWPVSHAELIAASMGELLSSVGDDGRRDRQAAAPSGVVESMIEQGERILLACDGCLTPA